MTMKKRIIAIIPARIGSTRFPAKMLASIMGKSLIQRTFEAVRSCQLLDDIFIATDDTGLYEHIKGFGGKALMTSIACPTGTDRLIDALQKHPEETACDYILNVQGDEPCISAKTIEMTLRALIDNPSEVMSTAAVKLSDPHEIINPSCVKCVMDVQGHALYFSRSPIPGMKPKGTNAPHYFKHLGIYAFEKNFLFEYGRLPQTPLQLVEDLEQLRVIESGYKIKVAIVDQITPTVDDPEDIQRVTEWLCSQNLYS
jgi:3-deoxy-manno-octulosonate cytidylyltransferase (CMP-KDO synthetase)